MVIKFKKHTHSHHNHRDQNRIWQVNSEIHEEKFFFLQLVSFSRVVKFSTKQPLPIKIVIKGHILLLTINTYNHYVLKHISI